MEKEKKKISCSYAVLVIILFATVCFLTDYILIDRKLRSCNCPKCEVTGNEVLSIDKDNIQNGENNSYNYENVVGYYSYSSKSETGEWFNDIHYSLYLYEDATFYLSYQHQKDIGGIMGNYILDGNEITLNYILRHISNGAVLFEAEGNSKLFIENNNINGILNLPGDLLVEVNISKAEGNYEQNKIEDFLDKFQVCNSTNNYCK